MTNYRRGCTKTGLCQTKPRAGINLLILMTAVSMQRTLSIQIPTTVGGTSRHISVTCLRKASLDYQSFEQPQPLSALAPVNSLL